MSSATRPDTPSSLSCAAARRPAGALATLLAASLSIAGAAAAIAQQSFDVALRDGLLTIRANGTPATALATALADETGVRFVVTGDAEQAITAEILDEPLHKAIALLSPNHLLVRGDAGADSPVIEVVLMMDDARDGTDVAGGGVGEAEFLPSGEPADEVFSDDGSVPPMTEEFEPGEGGAMDQPMLGPDEMPPESELGPDGQPPVQ